MGSNYKLDCGRSYHPDTFVDSLEAIEVGIACPAETAAVSQVSASESPDAPASRPSESEGARQQSALKTPLPKRPFVDAA